MNEKINIAEILIDAPKGTKLYSPIFGECNLLRVKDTTYPIVVTFNKDGFETTRCFTAFGKYTETDGAECMLYPSKDNRDWSTFKAPWQHKHFKPFQKVLVAESDSYYSVIWNADMYSHYNEQQKVHCTFGNLMVLDKDIIPYESNEDKLGKPVE